MPIRSVEPRRLYRQVADQLRELIDRGEFAVGQRLPTERELALQLGVSRPTVREALIALEVDGRVRIRVGSGIYVLPAPVEPKPLAAAPVAGPFELLQARALIEGAIAAEAALQARKADIRRLDDALEEMRSAAHPGPLSLTVDRAFHIAIAATLGNDAITAVVGDLFDQRVNPYFAQLASYFENAESWQQTLAEHQAIRDRLAAADSEGARTAMRDHLARSQQRFSESFGVSGGKPAETPPIAAQKTRRKRS